MNLKRMILLLLCAAMLLSLAACGGSPDPAGEPAGTEPPADGGASASDDASASSGGASAGGEKVLNVGWSYDPASLDPARAAMDSEYRLLLSTGEALLRGVDGEARPGAAESYEVNDQQTEYTFHLREGLTYSDGSPVTAEDYAYAMLRLLDPEAGYEQAETAFIFQNAEAYYNGECAAEDVGVEVVDAQTLRLTMEYPTYPISFCTWEFAPIKKDLAEELDIAYGSDADKVLTNGPFTVTSWVRDSEIVLEKNPNYWDADSVKLDRIVLKVGAEGDTAVDMMTAGELDAATITGQVQADALTAQGFLCLTDTTGAQCAHINHKGKTEETGLFLSNANFRKALSYAVDRSAMVATAYTTDIPATRVCLPNDMGVSGTYNDEHPYEAWSTSPDAEKARECLNKALSELGKTAADIPTFTVLCFDSANNMIAMNAIMDMWSQTLGIACEIDAQPIQNMLQKVMEGDYDFWKGGVEKDKVDSIGIFREYYGPVTLFGIENEEFDALFNAAQAATSWEARKDAMFELEQCFCDNMLDVVVTWISEFYIYSPSVTGVTMDPSGISFVYADLAA